MQSTNTHAARGQRSVRFNSSSYLIWRYNLKPHDEVYGQVPTDCGYLLVYGVISYNSPEFVGVIFTPDNSHASFNDWVINCTPKLFIWKDMQFHSGILVPYTGGVPGVVTVNEPVVGI